MSKITLEGFILVPESDLSAVEAELPNHIALTLAEPGCISFSVKQNSLDPQRFDVEEIFMNQEAFESHQIRVKESLWGMVTGRVERHYTIRRSSEST